MRAEADEADVVVAVPLTGQLSEVELTAARHIGVTRVAEMGVVRPDNELGGPTRRVQMLFDCQERFRHVAVAEIPRRMAATKHRAVVLLGVVYQACVLLGGEVLVTRAASIALCVVERPRAKLDERVHGVLLAGLGGAGRSSVTVGLTVLAEVLEARIPVPRPPRRFGIDAVEIRQHRLDRSVHAVEIETVKANPAVLAHGVVVLAQAADEITNDFVAPHPRGKALESLERLVRGRVIALVLEIAVDAVGVRPVALDADGGKVFLEDQPLRDRRTLGVELVRPVRRLANQDKTRVANELEERVIVAGAAA